MATDQVKMNSNVVETSVAEEDTIGVVAAPVWYALQPNTESDFGGDVTKTPRSFLTPDRQRRKGQTTDLDASGSMNHDVVQNGLQRLMQGFMFADYRYKPETGGMGDVGVITSVGAGNDYTRLAGSFITDGYEVGDIVFGQNFTNSANNGMQTVLTVNALTLVVNETLVAEAAPPAAAQLTMCGFQFAAGDLDVDAAGDLPVLTTVAKDCTEFNLVPGEFIYVGGDLAANNFAAAANAGFARVRSVTANAITLDKTEATFTTEVDATQVMHLFFGRVLKNETGTNIVRRTYNIERTLGAPDSALPAQIQSEYLVGAVPNEVTWNVPTSDLAKFDMSFVALDHEQRTGAVGVKAGTRVAAVEEEAYNTSSNVPRIKIATVSSTDAAPTPLFAYAEEFNVVVNNGVTPDKAIGTLGGFDATHGDFMVSGSATLFFADVAGVAAVRNNSDVTLEMHLVRSNQGMTLDLPLLSLGDGRLNVEKDQSIKLPITHDAATGASIDSGLNHTMLLVMWDYLPTIAG